jgi:DNA/RNA endonuclease YhcR with UshA esterase domain
MPQDSLPGHEEQPEEILCESCGRFVGALGKCPHCGARVEARLSLRVFRWTAVLLSTVGLGLLYLMSTHREIPIVRVAEIKATMNFAYVRVAGVVSEDARVNRTGDAIRSVRFTLNDGTGEIPVTAFRANGVKLVEQDRVPHLGDKVELTGSLSVSAERVALWLQAPDQMKLERAKLEELALADISKAHEGRAVKVTGILRAVKAPAEGSGRPWTLVLADSSGTGEINLWSDTYETLSARGEVEPGAQVRAVVAVGSFRGHTQLRLAQAEDLEVLSERAEADAVALGDLTKDDQGRFVKIRGRVAEIQASKGERSPVRVTLTDGENTLALVYWPDVAEQLGDHAPVVDADCEASGLVSTYKGRVQVKLGRASDLEVSNRP